jgi:hypothetical protein
MSLFNFFKNKNENDTIFSSNISTVENIKEIPENIFLEKDINTNSIPEEKSTKITSENGINILFQFLERNHESKGYDDALINPDNTHLETNIDALKNEIERTIRKIKIYYEDLIREINFHITSRSRSGMIDTVEELTVKKEKAESHIKQIAEIEQDAENNKGAAQGVILSYTKGFRNGLAAISHHSIIKTNF